MERFGDTQAPRAGIGNGLKSLEAGGVGEAQSESSSDRLCVDPGVQALRTLTADIADGTG